MASKIARKTASIFGGSLTAAAGGLNVFASFAQSGGTSATYSTDPAAIQSPQWLYGWDDALQGGLPVLEDLNSVDYVNSYQIAYLLQQGIAEWDAGTTYFINNFCSYNGQIFVSAQNTNLNQTPALGSAYWTAVSGASKGENLIRNGSMEVCQRTSLNTINTNSSAYTLDGWIVGHGADSAQITVTNPVTAQGIVLQMESTFASATATGVYAKQRIESTLMEATGYPTNFTFQALVINNSGSPITPTLTLNVPTVADNYTSITNILPATNLQTIANGSSAIVSYTFQSTSSFNNGLEAILTVGSIPYLSNIQVTNFDISSTPAYSIGLNNNPPTFKQRFIAAEILNCKRYLQAFDGQSVTDYIGSGFITAGTTAKILLHFQTQMRAIPTVDIASGNGSLVLSNYASTTSAVTSASAISGGLNSGLVTFTASGGSFNAGDGAFLYGSNATAPGLLLKAEL